MGVFVGSLVGSFIPALWGGDTFSFSSVIFSGIGAIGGLWLGYKISRY